MFENLKNHILADAAKKKEENRFYIENGYCANWAAENQKFSDEGIKRYCTAARWEAYQAEKISREKIVCLTVARMEKQLAKQTAAKIKKLETAAAAGDLISVSISVEWKKGSMGYNPTATVTIHDGDGFHQYTGKAGGYGYDKETAAVGEALNQAASVQKMLYQAKENALATFTPDQIAATKKGYVVESNRDFIAYGAGYGVLPYFEGGVGMSSFESVFNKCGFLLTGRNWGKRFDTYFFERKEV